MVNHFMRCGYRHLTTIVLVIFSLTVMASDTPPGTLPRGFLEQLPLLMQLNDQEFELLLKYAATNNSDKRRVDVQNEGNTGKGNTDNSKTGEHDEN